MGGGGGGQRGCLTPRRDAAARHVVLWKGEVRLTCSVIWQRRVHLWSRRPPAVVPSASLIWVRESIGEALAVRVHKGLLGASHHQGSVQSSDTQGKGIICVSFRPAQFR